MTNYESVIFHKATTSTIIVVDVVVIINNIHISTSVLAPSLHHHLTMLFAFIIAMEICKRNETPKKTKTLKVQIQQKSKFRKITQGLGGPVERQETNNKQQGLCPAKNAPPSKICWWKRSNVKPLSYHFWTPQLFLVACYFFFGYYFYFRVNFLICVAKNNNRVNWMNLFTRKQVRGSFAGTI